MFITYRSFSATDAGFQKTAFQLINNIPDKERVLTINVFSFFCDDNYLFRFAIINQISQEVFGSVPLLNLVAQSPENEDTLIAEVGYLSPFLPLSAVNYQHLPESRYLTIETTEFKALLVEGMRSDDTQKCIAEQSSVVFDKISSILQAVSMPVNSIIRQWNYIGDITCIENKKQNYQEFNNERARFYAAGNWQTGYPAATGISMDIHAVIVSLIAVKYHDKTRILPLNNSLQLAAHSYSETVLGKSERKETPKFERAKLMVDGSSGYCFISGTAAILGERSLGNDTVATQTNQTIVLIRHLISPENLKENGIDFSGELKIVHLRVYVKHATDFRKVRDVIEAELPGINVFYVCAPVCRDELLVEIEGVALQNLKY